MRVVAVLVVRPHSNSHRQFDDDDDTVANNDLAWQYCGWNDEALALFAIYVRVLLALS